MKKLLSLTIIFALIFTLSIPAFGNEDETLPAGNYWIDVTGGTANVPYARPGQVVTVTLDEDAVPEGKRFMLWQLAKLVEMPKTATVSAGLLAKVNGTVMQAAGVDLSASTSPFVNGTTLSSKVIQFIMPAATRSLAGTPANVVNNYPDDTLWISALYDSVADPSDEAYAVWDIATMLYEQTGVRLRGSAMERKAAELTAEKFRDYGYTDVVHYQPKFMNGSNVDQNNAGPTGGWLRFTDDSGWGDMFGNPNPNSAAFGTVTGDLVDFGTFTGGFSDLTIPIGLTGDVVAAVRFGVTATAAILNDIKFTAEAQNPGLTIKGFIWARAFGNYNNHLTMGSALALTNNLPNLAMNLPNLNLIMKNAEHFDHMFWQPASDTTNVVVAKKPAATDDPDLIIVLTGHMDTVANAMGASDNGSSASIIQALAKHYVDKDLGNIEVWFTHNGSEEGNSMTGARFIAQRLMTDEQRAKAININFDMVGTPAWFSGTSWGLPGAPLDSVTLDNGGNGISYGWPESMNLAQHLVSFDAKSVKWAPGINNVRINRAGGIDGARFTEVGVDSVTLLVVSNWDDALEFEYHTGGDNLYDNLSYDRMVMCYDLVKTAIDKAVNEQVSKRAVFSFDEENGRIALIDADKLFRTLDRVETVIGGQKVTFSKDDEFPGYQFTDTFGSFQANRTLGWGMSIADNDPLNIYATGTNAGLHRGEALGATTTQARFGLNGLRVPIDTIITPLAPFAVDTYLAEKVTSPGDFISMTETSKNSRVWVLKFGVTYVYSDDWTEYKVYDVELNGNNANLDGKYDLGDGYTLIYDIKGNGSNIKALRIVQ